jgi:SAM-dependent methyltransferase/RimJ/RimL family protein N-acetyltransferase
MAGLSNFTLEPLNRKHTVGLFDIVENLKVMKHIANGKTWDQEKTKRFIKFSEQEWESYGAMDVAGRGLAWAIMSGEVVHNTVVGTVAILPPKTKTDNYSLRIFLASDVQGKGIGTRASIQAIEYFRVFNANESIDIIIHKGNDPSIKSMNKVIAHFYGDHSEAIIAGASDHTIGKKDVMIMTMPTIKCEPEKDPKDYPYHTCFIPPAQVLVQNLRSQYRNFSSTEIGSGGTTDQLAFVKRKFPEQVLFADVLTDWFVEHERLQCIFGKDNISPLQFFEEYKSDIPKSSNPFIYRENIFEKSKRKKKGKPCNLFNLYLSLTLVDPYYFLEKNNPQHISDYWGNLEINKSNEIKMVRGPGHVLDPAAGWGDRLISSILTDAFSYTGFDTNTDLQPVYESIVNSPDIVEAYDEGPHIGDSFIVFDKRNFIVHNEPFEESTKVDSKKYDTIITSPPFFTVEIYKGAKTSTTIYETREEWFANYYKPMWEKCVRTLKPLGRIITYIAPWMFEDTNNAIMESSSDMFYLGHVDFVQFNSEDQIMDPRNHRPAFIWRHIPKEHQDKFYPETKARTPLGPPPSPPLGGPHTPLGPPPSSPLGGPRTPLGPPPRTQPGPGPAVQYYNDEESQRLPFQYFNNYVKEQLLERYRGYGPDSVLLDLASGKGGDIKKWCNARYTKVVGIELDPKGVNKANERYLKMRQTCQTDVVFIAGDSSKLIFPDQEAGLDEDNKRLMNKYVQKNAYDVVSMQFAVHYMFDSKKKLQRFIQNVSDTIKPGGVFIGTTFDGKKVLEKLGANTSINSTNTDGKDTGIWTIKMVKENSGFGALGKISVFVKSIGIPHEEHLVDFDEFAKIMSENGFTLEEKRSFDTYYDKYIHRKDEVPEDQLQFSFFNSTFVFRKGFREQPKIDDPCTCCSDFKDT